MLLICKSAARVLVRKLSRSEIIKHSLLNTKGCYLDTPTIMLSNVVAFVLTFRHSCQVSNQSLPKSLWQTAGPGIA